ncbi:thiamine-binding protein, partial [Parageobacillus thermoglucosidasius]|nr:thiamine-binding protein [Parageobacillus thermoglucosidasius]
RVATNLRIDDRRDKKRRMADKIASVQEKMK